jgi:hypothetical protein
MWNERTDLLPFATFPKFSADAEVRIADTGAVAVAKAITLEKSPASVALSPRTRK